MVKRGGKGMRGKGKGEIREKRGGGEGMGGDD